MTVINTNTKALLTQNALATNQRELADAMAALSTGKRINVAGDDAAGLAISTRMTSYARGLDQAVRNAGDAISLLQTIEGATIEFTNMMQRMRELAIQAASDTNANAERSFLNLEFQQLNQEMNRIANNTQWNGFNVLDGTARDEGAWRFQVGADAEQVIVHSAIDLRNLIASSVQAQQVGYPISDSLAAGEVASVTINGTSFTVSGLPETAQAGTFSVVNALSTGATATLAIGGNVYSATANNAVAQVATVTLDNAVFASTDTMSVIVNGTSYLLHGQQHNAMTGAAAAQYLASAINTASNVAQKDVFILSGTSVTSSDVFTIDLNGNTYAVAAGEHNATTASAMAVALASKINESPIARVAEVTINDSATTAGGIVSVTINGNTYVLGSAHADAKETMSMLVSVINGSAVAQAETFQMSSKSSNSAAQLTIAGNTYALLDNEGSLTAAQAATAMVAKIMGNDVAQIERFSMSTHSVNINNRLAVTVNGVAYSAPAISHTAVTQASAVAILASVVNAGQSAVSAFASGAVLTLRAAEAGTAFSTGSMSIGAQAALTGTVVTANNTAQTSVSAAVSAGSVVVVTALTAGNPFTFSAGNAIASAATATYNNTVASGFSASFASATASTATLTITATTAGVSFSNGANLGVSTSAFAITEARPNSEGQTAVSATVSGAALILTATNAGTAFSVGNAVNSGVASTTVSNYIANLNTQAAVSAIASGTTIVLTAVNAGTGFSVNGAAVGSNTFSATTTVGNQVGGYTASQVASILATTAQSSLSAISITASGGLITATALNTNTAFATGTLNDGTAHQAFVMTASATTGGLTASGTLTALVSAINASAASVVASATASSLVLTAATAGVAFSATDMTVASATIESATLRLNAAEGYTISTYSGAQATLAKLDETMMFINGERAKIGSVVNRLEYAIDNLRNISMNTKASRSQIVDADYAEQSTELARTQIIQQAATSVLAQANSTQESVLKLLQ